MDDPIVRLKEWQPEAVNIEKHDCDVCGGLLLSYTIGSAMPYLVNGRDGLRVDCGYWCADCGWSNAGARRFEEDSDNGDDDDEGVDYGNTVYFGLDEEEEDDFW